MKVTEVERTYCIEITPKQMLKLLKRDETASELGHIATLRTGSRQGYQTMGSKIINLFPGVSDVAYNAMLGPRIYVRIEISTDEHVMLVVEDCKKEIAKYVR